MFSKAFSRTQEATIQHAIMQLMMDWSFLFNREDLGRRSDRLLHEFCLRKCKSLRPTSLAGEVFQEVNSEVERTEFLRGFEFENRRDQIVLEDGFGGKATKGCRPPLHHGSFRLGSVKRIFSRSSSRSLASSKHSSIVMELSNQPPQIESKIEELNINVPPDCKKLQDLLSDLQVLISKGQVEDLESKMQGAESLRNKCMEWKHKIQELISIKLHKNNQVENSQSEVEINPLMFAKLLTIGENLHGVLARFEQIHKEYLTQMASIEENNSESFESARSASSTGSITFESTGDFNWVQFSTESKISYFWKIVKFGLDEFRRSASLGNEATTKKPVISYQLPTSARTLNGGSSALEGVSQIPRPPPPATNQPGEVLNKEKVLISELPKTRSSRLPERSLNRAALGAPSRSFSELKSVQDQVSNSKRISNCPALKVKTLKM